MKREIMKILVTGGMRFIGPNLCHFLTKQHLNLWYLGNLTRSYFYERLHFDFS